MLEELYYTSVMKPVFSLDRLATTDLTHTIIGASNLTNSALPLIYAVKLLGEEMKSACSVW